MLEFAQYPDIRSALEYSILAGLGSALHIIAKIECRFSQAAMKADGPALFTSS